MTEPKYLGNNELLKRQIIGFFSSRTTAPLSVLPTLDWARNIARDPAATVMSGFQSPIEREVLAILLGGKCGIIAVLNRSIYREVPPSFEDVYADHRILFISLLGPNIRRPSTANASQRNRYIADTASSLVFSSVAESSSLYPIFQEYAAKTTLVL